MGGSNRERPYHSGLDNGRGAPEKGAYVHTDEYFERLLEQIREIRLSERKFYQKVTDLYATAFDYDKDANKEHMGLTTWENAPNGKI